MFRTVLIVLASVVLAALCGSPRGVMAYTATGAGYTLTDSDEPGGPAYAWDDISESGTVVGFAGDDGQVTVALPFSFTFMGASHSSVSLCENGFLQFGGTDVNPLNDSIPSSPSPNNALTAFWDNLMNNGESQLRYETLGATPNRRFVVSWQNWIMEVEDSLYDYVTFQVALYEGSGAVRVQYEVVPDPSTLAPGYGCTVGIENGAGTEGLQYLYNDSPEGNGLYPGLAIEFLPTVPPGGPQAPAGLTQSDDPMGPAAPVRFVDTDGAFSFRANVSHSNPATSVQLEVEVKPAPGAFDGTGLLLGNVAPGSGGTSSATASGLANGGYKWRARTVAGEQASAWVQFDAPPAPDFTVTVGGGGEGGGSPEEGKRRDMFCGGAAGGSGHALWLAVLLAAIALTVRGRALRRGQGDRVSEGVLDRGAH